MATKSKRIIYSDADCHLLVDIVTNYRNIVECKKTDATTWKEKSAIWEKIAQSYNSATTEPRTSEQLRCKYDNLKKDVRKYEAQKKQNLYKTGGGAIDPDVKAVIKLLYDKIKSLISFSVDGLEPSQGDSDVIVDVEHTKTCSTDTLIESSTDYSDVGTSKCDKITHEGLPSTSQPPEPEAMDFQDWSNYTPKMLKSRKHQLLQVKRKKMDVEDSHQNTDENMNVEMFRFKKELLQKEADRDEMFHEMRMKKEEELYAHKIKNQMLLNEKLELEISLLKKQLRP